MLNGNDVYIDVFNESGFLMPKTPKYRLRSNKVQLKLKSLCLQWMKENRAEVVRVLRRKAQKVVGV